ncbi:hypothetical protein HK097_006482, partial [Rhizophlyctis rosea]
MSVTQTVSISTNSSIELIIPSPDWTHFVVQTADGNLHSYKFESNDVIRHPSTSLNPLSSLDIFRTTNILVSATHTGSLRFWNTETQSPLFTFQVPAKIT